ncbi:structural maintenance of chromosome protein [Heterostelium album PN500]|uniref:Structural maintenance of chromosomes protein 5 n=1 Tax=Heterostelium pallidum (strain ATCC 26659 / Pp 5 / PN500) TaxID=670386 RepID=D3BMU2_HETP5|nr:structural maintenance of chromosome protein [Heterostelium album PN500]EFA77304.1 structural maintenance of chromosome protein [Heterostelium album PN500]|eukprot:XP_020429433.1 structural maintenance of chromosome protein [Heterostelium album PN500]
MSINGNRKRIIEEDDEDENEHSNNNNNVNNQRRRLDMQPTQSSGSTPAPASQNYITVPPAKVYMEGSIVRVKLTNFVTYTELEFVPGPRLNVIIGPNGSGKSSIICALALGLGGGPALLGRAKQVSHFIKHGEDHAIIEIELYVQTGNIVIQRLIRKDNSSEYRVNRSKVTANDLHELIRKHKIQVDNLCQFLPQDKVVSFAAMTPTELLQETEKAIGLHDLYENHMKLIEERKNVLQKQTQFSGHEGILEDLKKQNESLEKEVERFKQRKEYLQKVDLFQKKRLWVLVDIAQNEVNEATQARNEIDGRVKALEKEKAPLQKAGDVLKGNIEKLDHESTKHSTDVKKTEQETQRKSAAIEKYNDQIDSFHNELDNIQKRADERLAKIALARQNQQNLTENINNLPNEDVTRAKIEEKNKTLREINVQQGQIRSDISNAKNYLETLNMELRQVNGGLDALSNINAIKLESLRRNAKSVFDAYQNIKMRLKDRFNKTFVVSILLYLPDVNTNWGRDYQIDNLQQYGVECFLDQTFEADKLIKDVLVSTIPLQNIAAGTKASIGKEEELHRKTGIQGFFTPVRSYNYSQSRYGDKNTITRITALKDAKLLSQGEKNNLNRKKQEIEGRLTEAKSAHSKLQDQEQEINRQVKMIHTERQELQSLLDERKKLYSKLHHLNRQIEDMSVEENTDQMKADIKKKIQNAHLHRVNNIREVTNFLLQIGMSMSQRDLVTLKRSKAEAKYRVECAALENLIRQINDLKINLKTAIDQFNVAKKKLQGATEVAEREAPFDDYADMFEGMPDDIEEIDDEIESYNEKARQIGNTDPKVMQDYENRQKEIQTLTNKIGNHKAALEESQARMEELKSEWLIPVREFIADINEKFTQFFKEIRCMGEVLLGYNEKDPDNFEQYSIDIRVRFRDEDPMQSLTAHLQSGGERSVATMLFLISLQGLTNCPFRAVDEINQGMDPKNERMIFDQIVKSANKPGRPQYFLITPKLLHDLEYSKNTTVLCVYTGPWHVNQSEWDKMLKKCIEAKSKSK